MAVRSTCASEILYILVSLMFVVWYCHRTYASGSCRFINLDSNALGAGVTTGVGACTALPATLSTPATINAVAIVVNECIATEISDSINECRTQKKEQQEKVTMRLSVESLQSSLWVQHGWN